MEDFNQFKAAPMQTTAKGLGKLALKSTATGFKVAPKLMTGAAVAGMTGNAVTGVAAGYVSQGGPISGKFSRKMTEYADKDLGKLQEDSYTKRLANAIDDFRMDSYNSTQDKFMSDEEIYNKCIDLYDTDISTLTDATEKKLAKRLQDMRDLYDGRGEADSAAKVMSKVSNIQANGANHSIQIRSDNIASAAALYQMDTGERKENVIQEVVRIQDGINNSSDANENYWRSAQYRGLDKNGKKLAKEIYKSKKLTTAIGNAPQDKLDKAVEEKLKDKLV